MRVGSTHIWASPTRLSGWIGSGKQVLAGTVKESPRSSDGLTTHQRRLIDAPQGPVGQPVGSPFSKDLAEWHKHQQVCVLPDGDATIDLSKDQCADSRGDFIPETPWMVHAWIWQDSPPGAFSYTNPTVK